MEVQQTAAKKTNAVYIYVCIYIYSKEQLLEIPMPNIYVYICMYVCIYIGETSQYQQCRDRGHKDAIKACPNHEINWMMYHI